MSSLPVLLLPSLPSNASIEPCREQHIVSLRRLNALLLPIPYRDDFYKEILSDNVTASITRVALWHENPSTRNIAASSQASTSSPPCLVAAIRCRHLKSPPNNVEEKTSILYISTITTLAPFRRHGLANHLLTTVARTAVESYDVIAIMAHVWEANDEGLEWYKNRGFVVVSKEDVYYRRLAPKTAAFLVRKDIGPSDLLAWQKVP